MRIASLQALAVGLLSILPTAAAQAESGSAAANSKVADFYRGNTVYMIIGSASGGGFDTYARIIGRFMAKHLPGNPTVVPQNMPGGGGFTAGNRVAVTAPQDGTYIGAIHPTTIVDPVLGDTKRGAKALKLAYLGSASTNIEACFLRTDAPAKSFEDGFKIEMRLGATQQASSSREYAALLKNVLGMKIAIVAGYTGNAEVLLAMDRGEIEGTCAGYQNVVASRPDWFKKGLVRVISHQGTQPRPEMQGARPAVSYAKTDEQRRILELYDLQGAFGRPYATGGDVPTDRVAALREAFMSALNDPELRKEVEAKGLEVSPVSGAELQSIVSRIYDAPPELLKKIRVALEYQ